MRALDSRGASCIGSFGEIRNACRDWPPAALAGKGAALVHDAMLDTYTVIGTYDEIAKNAASPPWRARDAS